MAFGCGGVERKITNVERKPTDAEMNESVRRLRINTAAILGAIWGGVFGYEAFANYILSEQLFDLVLLGLIIAATLTIAVLVYGILMAYMVINAPRADVETIG